VSTATNVDDDELHANPSHTSQNDDDSVIAEDPGDNAEASSPQSGDSTSPSQPPREVNLPNPLPSYITKIDKPPSRGMYITVFLIN